MRTPSSTRSGFLIPRLTLAMSLFAGAALLGFFSFAANPPSGTLTEGGGPITYTSGPFLQSNPSGFAGLLTCNAQLPCDEFALTVNVASAEFAATKEVKVSVSWSNTNEDYDIYALQGGNQIKEAASSANPEVLFFSAVQGTNNYTIRIVPFAVAGGTTTAVVEFVDKPLPPAPPPAGSVPVPPRYDVFVPPPGMGNGAGEPTIGIGKPLPADANHGPIPAGRTMFVAGTRTLRITFDDCASPATNLWEDVTAPSQPPVTLDPILFTDRLTGRTFVSQLLGKASATVYTDNDGGEDPDRSNDYLQSQGSGINSGVDHQTIGSGPFAPPLTGTNPVFPNAVYYASQDAAIAQAALSVDGGQTFGPAVPMYNITQCAGIHGHLKVAPDGTAYVPNKSCGGKQAVVVSENNGVTWEVRPVPGTTAISGIVDPAVGIGADGTVYMGGVNANNIPYTAVSKDRGKTWINYNPAIGTNLGIKKATFPQMTAGDSDRAAFAFLGAKEEGDYQAHEDTPNGGGYKGEWHMYVSTTYDGGLNWTTVDATPNDPVQRNSICNGGTVCMRTPDDRNLLDFNDIQIDREGRVQVAFADGCITPACIQGVDADGDGFKDNDYTARATLVRQSGGKRLLAAFDSTDAEPNAPAPPRVDSVARDPSGVVTLRWSSPDNGGSPVTGFNVYRRQGVAGTYERVGNNPTVPADKTSYEDNTATAGVQYFYKVTALNAEGESTNCGEFEAGLPPIEETPCILPGKNVLIDGAGDALTGLPQHDARAAYVAELFDQPDKIVFTVKVTSLETLPPNTYWPIEFKSPNVEDRFEVRMSTRAPGTPTAPVFEYGPAAGLPNNLPTDFVPADPASSYSPDGTIRIVVPRSGIGNPAVGQALTGFLTRIAVEAGANPTPDNMGGGAVGIEPIGSYTIVGNDFCRPNTPPLAVLSATPTSGEAPLNVAFSAAGSGDGDVGDTIATYKFNFGDGTSSDQPGQTVSHVYNDPGSYRATLSVTDSRGETSENVAAAVIEVGLLRGVTSRKAHGSAGTFDIEMPLSGNPGIESRTGGPNGNQTMVFTFLNPITSVGSVTVTGESGNPSIVGAGTGPGPNPNEYTVNLTGVANAQTITVTLSNVTDSQGSSVPTVTGRMRLLFCDVNGTGVVTGSDLNLAKAQQSRPVVNSNFRTDVNATGVITGSDVNLIKANQSAPAR